MSLKEKAGDVLLQVIWFGFVIAFVGGVIYAYEKVPEWWSTWRNTPEYARGEYREAVEAAIAVGRISAPVPGDQQVRGASVTAIAENLVPIAIDFGGYLKKAEDPSKADFEFIPLPPTNVLCRKYIDVKGEEYWLAEVMKEDAAGLLQPVNSILFSPDLDFRPDPDPTQ